MIDSSITSQAQSELSVSKTNPELITNNLYCRCVGVFGGGGEGVQDFFPWPRYPIDPPEHSAGVTWVLGRGVGVSG